MNKNNSSVVVRASKSSSRQKRLSPLYQSQLRWEAPHRRRQSAKLTCARGAAAAGCQKTFTVAHRKFPLCNANSHPLLQAILFGGAGSACSLPSRRTHRESIFQILRKGGRSPFVKSLFNENSEDRTVKIELATSRFQNASPVDNAMCEGAAVLQYTPELLGKG